MEMREVARWAFLAFVVIAIVMGLVIGYMVWNGNDVSKIDPYVTLVLLILGIVVGLISVGIKEVTPFLIATIALVVAGTINVWSPLETIHPLLSTWATWILKYIVAFAAPAAVIVAVRLVFSIAREK